MKCAWEPLINLLPLWMRDKVNRLGKETMRELRLRINAPPELVLRDRSVFLDRLVSKGDIELIINLATQYSPWASETVGKGFITIPGGHRIGICGIMIPDKRNLRGFSTITSLCIRVSRDFIGIAKNAVQEGSILIIGSPGSGKTTFLRDLIRQNSVKYRSRISVVDERFEIFPTAGNSFCYETGTTVDIISGCPKEYGVETMLRTMTPTIIAVDEITAQADAEALIRCIGCGVSLLATAHASSVEDLKSRNVYRSLLEYSAFRFVIVLHSDYTWHMEKCTK